MKGFHRLFIASIAAIIVFAASLAAFLFISLIPYTNIIGLTAAGVVIVGLLCVAVLMVAFTGNKIGAWSIKRRIIAHGEVVVYLAPGGEFVHLSAEHEMAKLPAPRITHAAKDEAASDETILEFYDKGMSLMDIADKCHTTYYRVQKLTSSKR